MLLAVDVGNTHTVLGLFDEARLDAHWRIPTRRDATTDELGALVRALFAGSAIEPARVTAMIVAAVVPGLDRVVTAVGERTFGVAPLLVGPGVKTGMPILYENPHEVGADRIVNAVAALARRGAPVIVVDFGTATTFDVIGAGGEYLGGVIAPGLGVSAEALFQRAARLHRVDVRRPPRVVGRNTEHSIQSGLYHGYAGLVEGLVRRIQDELGTQAPVIATGGLAGELEAELELIDEVVPQLTLEGLRLIWDRNRR